jgi:hypothetical protein
MKPNSNVPTTILGVLTRAVTRRGLLACVLCSLAIAASASSASADERVPVTILGTWNKLATPNPGFSSSWAGIATLVIGTEPLTATVTMDVVATPTPSGGISHCTYVYTLDNGAGTLVLHAVCWSTTEQNHGAWQVGKSTGVFKGFTGLGTSTFGNLPSGDKYMMYERFQGTGKHSDADHGDKN